MGGERPTANTAFDFRIRPNTSKPFDCLQGKLLTGEEKHTKAGEGAEATPAKHNDKMTEG